MTNISLNYHGNPTGLPRSNGVCYHEVGYSYATQFYSFYCHLPYRLRTVTEVAKL